MREFSISRAWSEGLAFIGRAPGAHAIILILIGVVVPTVLQFAAIGGPANLANPAMMGQDAAALLALGGGALIAVMALGYVLQTGSYFGSWRIGLAREESLGGAIVYGLLAGLVVILGLAAVGAVGAVLAQAIGGIAFLLLAIVFLPAFAALYTVMMAMMAVGMFLAILIGLLFGASLGMSAMTPDMMGAGVVGLVVVLLIMLLFLWLAARFSCTTSAMADSKSVNFVAGLGESWRLTSGNQLRIMLYLALVGVLLGLVFLAYISVLGASMASGLAGGGAPEIGIGALVVGILFGIGAAYVGVLIPAGIYRSLRDDSEESAAVFA